MISAGSLGGWETVVFPVTEKRLIIGIDSLFKSYPEYHIPEKWKYDTEHMTGNNYSNKKVYYYYFVTDPEEMYFVTFIDAGSFSKNPNYARIAVRAVGSGDDSWKLNKNCDEKEKLRIAKRFHDEIVTKLEDITKTKSFKEE